MSTFSAMGQIQMEIVITNLTTKIKFKPTPEPTLCEFEEKKLVLEVASKNCAKNHQLLIEMKASIADTNKVRRFSATVTVEELEAASAGKDKISVRMIQFEQKEYAKFQELIATSQDNIDAVMTSMRGY